MASYDYTSPNNPAVVMGTDTWFMYYLSGDGHTINVRTALIIRVGDKVNVPLSSDWMDQGSVLSEGSGWDKRFEGALSPCTVVYKDGTYFLYYIGADGDRSTDGGPRHRALGVATSSDGLHFEKQGIILSFLPHGNEEEGIFSAAALVDDNNEIVIYYSALDAGNRTSTTVNSDVRRAVSTNGISFTDRGEVLSHDDSSVGGYGDELFPIGVFLTGTHPNDTWTVFYVNQSRNLFIAQGSDRDGISSSTRAVSGMGKIWGGCDPIQVSPNEYVLFSENKIGMISSDSPYNIYTPTWLEPVEPEPTEPEPTPEGGTSLEKLIPETPSIEELKPEGAWGEKPFTVKLEKLWQELQKSEKGTLGGLFPERPEITPPELEATWGQRPFEATWPGGQQQTWASPEGQLSPPRPEYEPYEPYYPLPPSPEGELSPFDRPILGEDFYSQLEALGNSLILSMSQTEGISSLLGG